MEIAVPTPQTCRIPGRMRVEDEPILLHIPGWRGRENIINDKPDEIHEQKGQRKPQKHGLILIEQVPGESQRQRHPAEIEKTGRDIKGDTLMREPVLIRRQSMDAEKSLLQRINIPDMHEVIPVIGKSLHGIEEHPKHDKDAEPENKTPRRTRDIKKTVE